MLGHIKQGHVDSHYYELIQTGHMYTQETEECFFSLSFPLSPVLLLTVPGAEAIKQEVDGEGQKENWECKKVELDFN